MSDFEARRTGTSSYIVSPCNLRRRKHDKNAAHSPPSEHYATVQDDIKYELPSDREDSVLRNAMAKSSIRKFDGTEVDFEQFSNRANRENQIPQKSI